MNRAVGLGPLLDGPLDFLRIGGGSAPEPLELIEDCRGFEASSFDVLGISVVLDVLESRSNGRPCD